MEITSIGQLIIGGLTIGVVYGLVGLAFAVMLKATDLLNFAQGEMVMLGALTGYTLLSALQVPFIVAFLVCSIFVGMLGILMERFILRPILTRKSPLLVLLISTVGLSLTLQALGIVIWGAEPMRYPGLTGETLEFAGLVLRPQTLWILGLGLVTVVGFHLFLHRTLTGISWRASALAPEAAALMGVSRKRNVALTFAISSGLGGAAGVLLAPIYFASFNLGATVIVKSFVAAGIGGFGLLGSILGGLAIGVTETIAAGFLASQYKDAVMYGVLIIALLMLFRSKRPEGRSVSDIPRTALVSPFELGSGDLGLWLRLALIGAGIGVWFLLPLALSSYAIHVLTLALIYGVSVLGLQVIVGYGGLLSFAQSAFFAIGAYTSALATMRLGVPFPLALILAGLVAGTASLLLVPILRLGGHYLAVATIAVHEIVVVFMIEWESLTNGAYGISGIPAPEIGPLKVTSDVSYFILTSFILLVAFLGLRFLMGSRFGRELVALRENELAASSVGINPVVRRAQAFVVGTACAGVAGGLYAHFVKFIMPEKFPIEHSLTQIVMSVVGGLGHLAGAVLGPVMVIALPEALRALRELRIIIYGLVVVVFMLWLPGGMMELLTRVWNRWVFKTLRNFKVFTGTR